MPTVTIRTAPLSANRRRTVAVRLTRWLVDEGVAADRAVIRFEELPAQSVFVAGLPTEAMDRRGGAHASVTCAIDTDRDREFRGRLAEAIVGALPAGDDMPFVYLEFRPTSPADVWIARYGAVGRASD